MKAHNNICNFVADNIYNSVGEDICNSVAEIDLNLIKHNIEQIRLLIGTAVDLMCVVKGNAYGHGIVEVARFLTEECGITKLAVSHVKEALWLRKAGLNCTIMVLGGVPLHNIEAAVYYDISIPLFQSEIARKLSQISGKLGKQAKVHIKIETGLGRIGVRPGSELQAFLDDIKLLPGLFFEGVFTHYASAGAQDKTYAREQLSIFKGALEQLRNNRIEPLYVHTANSSAVLDLPESYFNLVRAGGLIYGYYISDCLPPKIDLRPALTWKTWVTHVKSVEKGESIGYSRLYIAERPMKVATLSIGYGDGFSSHLSNKKGHVIVGNNMAPVVGQICMDQTMVDVSDAGNVKVGDEVLIIGRRGDLKIDAFDIAKASGQPYPEVLATIGRRVSRRYIR